MSGYEASSLTEIAAILEAADTAEDAYHQTLPYSARALAAVAADRAGTVLSATVTLTDDQIKGLPNAPVEIVPAPGAGLGLFYHSGFVYLDARAGGYTGVHDSYMWIGPEPQGATFIDNTSGGVLIPKPTSAGGTTNHIYAGTLGPILYEPEFFERFETDTAEADYAAAGFFLQYGDGLDFTGGHPDNFLRCTVWYSLVEIG